MGNTNHPANCHVLHEQEFLSNQCLHFDRDLYIHQIFVHLSFQELFKCRQVSRCWNYMVLQVRNVHVIISDTKQIDSFEKVMKKGIFHNVAHLSTPKLCIKYLGKYMRNLESIHVVKRLEPNATILQCQCLEGLDNLKEIVFKGSQVVNAKLMRNCKSLKRIEIRYLKNNEFWENIVSPLEEFVIFNVKMGFNSWKVLVCNIKKSLKVLKIGKCTFTKLEYDEMSEFQNLESLTLTQMSEVTDECFKFFSNLKYLKSLKIQSCNLSSEACYHLNSLKKLTKLDMSDNIIDQLSFINGMKEIRSLKLMDNRLGNEGCLFVSALPSITKLFLTGNEISNEGLLHISQMTNLTDLDLGNNKITSIELITENLTKLQKLGIYVNRISSADVSKLVDLRELNFSHNKLTSLKGLNNLKHLQNLFLYGNKLATKLFTSESHFPKLEYLEVQSMDNINLKILTKERFPKLIRITEDKYDLRNEQLDQN
ncbi:LRR_RI domain-containing protein [Naegleria gruberi]|uniref:LRR_RI domain-containing protein n=1 Tax=Naegleria gruberi TaxID=5762 RepID=D2VFZ8_NAEGR|nr:LRR_RI domain-containing protein [Naegleria gruberi]EFC44274.1 LRR_RI domain-containing protein [Naegleria gruberi]|eukprot:XP_002677018.1 LRR_RI domain-containing protein [Naegleria gruberi strain NEG-M]